MNDLSQLLTTNSLIVGNFDEFDELESFNVTGKSISYNIYMKNENNIYFNRDLEKYKNLIKNYDRIDYIIY